MTKMIMLERANNRTPTLAGHDQGLAARISFKLQELDRQDEVVELVPYDELEAISTSFIQGLFAESLKTLGEEKFLRKYNFRRLPDYLKLDVELGLRRLKMKRRIAGA